jgi:hypothetical protein
MNKRTAALATTGLAAALALAPATAAQAAPKYKVNFDGLGSYTQLDDGSAMLTGTATGAPFDGRYAAVLRADDGTLPAPGECEPGSAAVYLDGPRHRFLLLTAHDDVCGIFLQEPYVVTHQFVGTYHVAATSERKLRSGDGWLEVRLATEDRSGVTAIDT